jgi:hypothetical protein
MANVLSKSGITNASTIQAWHVSQSVDALTAVSAYDITISGSLTVTGSTNITGSTTVIGALTASGSLNVSGTVNMPGFSNNTASWATNLVNTPSSISRYIAPSGSTPTLFVTQMIAGAGQINSGQSLTTIDITPIDFTGKSLGTDVFITVGISSSYNTSSMSYYPRASTIGPNSITFTTSASVPFNVPFFYTVVYKA